MKKYEFTENKKDFFGTTLYQIRALMDIPAFGVKKGDLGGWIKSESNLSHEGDCWIGDNAYVFGNAMVYGNAYVFGNAMVYGNAYVFDNVMVSGNARVFGNARIYGNARVFDNVIVCGNASVFGNARVSGNACLVNNAHVYGNAHISGDSWIGDNAKVYGNAYVFGKAYIYGYAQIEKQEDIFCAISVGSENGNLTVYKNSDGSVQVVRGCFNGTLEEFEEAVKRKHKGTKYEEEYLALIGFIRCRFNE